MKKQKEKNAQEAQQFKEKVVSWAKRIKVQPEQVRLQKMTRKWASHSTSGRMTFSTDLLNESDRFQDYVIVHELLHMRIPNHGRLFKSVLSAYVPEWRRCTCVQFDSK
ncbi:MAG: M48 family peptidase [Candidatus Abyssobacteria bacterium SURF_5]|uniref:M48 family peptidase n=1 Tax=Abyssobacteria bacterium (strain SURF_5) TaxID=2093360 RepID=A0A3A4P055_ABYX5|nr:MAG: M48 family peptidase [Candidatus Abyssubacteria bacterium SURF_5]